MNELPVRLIATGGTIDSVSETSDTKLSVFEGTHIPQMLKEGRVSADIVFEPLMMKDSLDIVDADREKILASCLRSSEDRIVVTPGTHTMADTAKYLSERLRGRTVVLVGAMVPFAWQHSDAMFNLGYAIAYAQTLPHGVYVAMNGKVFAADNIRKNKATGVFENEKKG